jgi:hypothetical protein
MQQLEFFPESSIDSRSEWFLVGKTAIMRNNCWQSALAVKVTEREKELNLNFGTISLKDVTTVRATKDFLLASGLVVIVPKEVCEYKPLPRKVNPRNWINI